MYSFTYNAAAARVLFGSGTVRELGNELERLGLKRALFLATPGQEEFVRTCARAVGPVAVGFSPTRRCILLYRSRKTLCA